MLSGGTATALIASSAHRRDLADVLCIDSVCQSLSVPDRRHEAMDGKEDIEFSGSSLKLDEHKAVMGSEGYSVHEILLARLTKSLPHKRSPILSAVSRLDSARPNFPTFPGAASLSNRIATNLVAS